MEKDRKQPLALERLRNKVGLERKALARIAATAIAAVIEYRAGGAASKAMKDIGQVVDEAQKDIRSS